MNKIIRIQARKISKIQSNVNEFKLLMYTIQCNSDLNDELLKSIEIFNERWRQYDIIHDQVNEDGLNQEEMDEIPPQNLCNESGFYLSSNWSAPMTERLRMFSSA